MNASISYAVRNLPHPWREEERKEGVHAWCLVKIIKPAIGPSTEEPVALFNWDSEAQLFMGHVLAAGLDGQLVSIDPDFVELQKLRQVR